MEKVKETIEIFLDFLEGKNDTESALSLYKSCILNEAEDSVLLNKYISCLCGDNLDIPSEIIYDEIETYLIHLLKCNVTHYLVENGKEDLINKIDFTFINVKEIRRLINN